MGLIISCSVSKNRSILLLSAISGVGGYCKHLQSVTATVDCNF